MCEVIFDRSRRNLFAAGAGASAVLGLMALPNSPMAANRVAAIAKSADLLYPLLVGWSKAGIRPEAVWMALEKREVASGLLDSPNGPSSDC